MTNMVPYLTVHDAAAAIAFYAAAFGAQETGERDEGDGGSASSASPSAATRSTCPTSSTSTAPTPPRPSGTARARSCSGSTTPPRSYAAAVAAGATPDREPSDQGDEKRGWLVDPFGHRWAIHSPIGADAMADGVAGRRAGRRLRPDRPHAAPLRRHRSADPRPHGRGPPRLPARAGGAALPDQRAAPVRGVARRHRDGARRPGLDPRRCAARAPGHAGGPGAADGAGAAPAHRRPRPTGPPTRTSAGACSPSWRTPRSPPPSRCAGSPSSSTPTWRRRTGTWWTCSGWSPDRCAATTPAPSCTPRSAPPTGSSCCTASRRSGVSRHRPPSARRPACSSSPSRTSTPTTRPSSRAAAPSPSRRPTSPTGCASTARSGPRASPGRSGRRCPRASSTVRSRSAYRRCSTPR